MERNLNLWLGRVMLWLTLVMILCLRVFAVRQNQPSIRIAAVVEVTNERFTLGEIAELKGFPAEQQAQVSAIELGMSPVAGTARAFTRIQVEVRLRQRGVDLQSLALEIPASFQIKRRAQTVSTEELLTFAREQLRNVLGEEAAGWQTSDQPAIQPLPEGKISLKADGEPRIGTSYARVGVLVQVDEKVKARVSFTFQPSVRTRTALVKPGEEVTVRVRSGDLTVETTGVARSSGAQDEMINVYVADTKKTLRARVIEKGIVEIKP